MTKRQLRLFSQQLLGPPTKRYAYVGSCATVTDVEALNKMTEQATDITYGTMLRNCAGLLEWAVEHGYERRVTQGITLRTDWHVSYHKSTFKDVPCYFLRWSGFEHIWTLNDHERKLAELGGKWMRDELRKQSLARPIKPPENVERVDQKRSVNHDPLVKIVDIEPQSRAMGIIFKDPPEMPLSAKMGIPWLGRGEGDPRLGGWYCTVSCVLKGGPEVEMVDAHPWNGEKARCKKCGNDCTWIWKVNPEKGDQDA